MTKSIIKFEDFSYSRKGRRILNDISLEISDGEYLAIIGPNGAGKSSLLKCINGIWHGRSGQIFILGRSLTSFKQYEIAQMIAYVPQGKAQQARLSVEAFVMMSRYSHRRLSSSTHLKNASIVEDSLNYCRISHLRDRSLNALSGGEWQKVLLAGALAQESQILLLDEPTTYLDPGHQCSFREVIRKVRRDKGSTIIHTTHDLSSAFQDADRIIAINEGRIELDSTQEQLTERQLRALYRNEECKLSVNATTTPLFKTTR